MPSSWGGRTGVAGSARGGGGGRSSYTHLGKNLALESERLGFAKDKVPGTSLVQRVDGSLGNLLGEREFSKEDLDAERRRTSQATSRKIMSIPFIHEPKGGFMMTVSIFRSREEGRKRAMAGESSLAEAAVEASGAAVEELVICA